MESLEAPQRLAIHLLGEFCVSVDSRAIDEREWTSRKARSLVQLLALAPRHRLHREQVMDRLWPALDAQDAANNLHKALHIARRILEPALPPRRASAFLHLRHDVLLLEAPGDLWIDVEAFQAAAAQARRVQTARAYSEALQLYTGELVPADRYEDWVLAARDRLSGLRATLLVELAGVQEQSGDLGAAIDTLQQVVASDPLHEEAQGRLMRLLVQAGRRHVALRHYQTLRAAWQRELEAEPDRALQALYQDILGSPASGPAPHQPAAQDLVERRAAERRRAGGQAGSSSAVFAKTLVADKQ